MNPLHRHCLDITRRHFFRDCGVGLGKIALAGLLTDSLATRGRAAGPAALNPLLPRKPHFEIGRAHV